VHFGVRLHTHWEIMFDGAFSQTTYSTQTEALTQIRHIVNFVSQLTKCN